MITREIISPSEMIISNYSSEQLPKWKMRVKDGRVNRDLGKFGISIFMLDEVEIEPIFIVAKIKRSGTTISTYLKTHMSNGDLLEFKKIEITSTSERDELIGTTGTYSFTINGEDLRPSRYICDFDSIRDFYSKEWIPSQNLLIL